MIDLKRPVPRMLVKLGTTIGLTLAAAFGLENLVIYSSHHPKEANPYHGPMPQHVHGPNFPNANDMPNLGELKVHMAKACPSWHLSSAPIPPIVALNYWRECDQNSVLQKGLHGQASQEEIDQARKSAMNALGPSGQEIERALNHAGTSIGARQGMDAKCPGGEIPVSPLGIKGLTRMVCEPIPDGDPPFTTTTPNGTVAIPQPKPSPKPTNQPSN